MNRQESIELTARIQEYIGSSSPVLPSVNDPSMVRELVSRAFPYAPKEYLDELEKETRCLSAFAFRTDPYLRAMEDLPDRIVSGRFTLARVSYEAGEVFAYDAPKTSGLSDKAAGGALMVPRLGFFPDQVFFPAVYEEEIPWMSICPSEMNTLEEPIRHARDFVRNRAADTAAAGGHGARLLVLGLGLGYFPFLLAEEETVEKIVIVEYSEEIIRLFTDHLLPYFPHEEKISVVRGDAFEYLRKVSPDDFDYVFADTWESQYDGAKDYLRVRRQEKRLNPDPEKTAVGFSYWIEPQIRAYLENELGMEEF